MTREDFWVTGARMLTWKKLASVLALGALTGIACRRARSAALATAAYPARAAAYPAAGRTAARLVREIVAALPIAATLG